MNGNNKVHVFEAWALLFFSRIEHEILTLEEQKQILIDAYINLMRIKRVQKEINEELEYQIKTTKVKLSTFGIDISELEY